MSLLGPLQPAVEALFASRHERIVAAEVVSTLRRRSRNTRQQQQQSHRQQPRGSPALVLSQHEAQTPRREERVPTLLVLCTPMETTAAAAGNHAPTTVKGGAAAAAGGLFPKYTTAAAAASVLYTLDIKSDTQVQLRHSLPLSRLVGTSVENTSLVDLTFDFGGSGSISVQFESNIQREMMAAAIDRLRGSRAASAGATTSAAALLEDGAVAAGDVTRNGGSAPERRRGGFSAEEEEKLLQYIGESGLDDTEHFQEVLLHGQKSMELKLLHTLVENSSLWATAKEQVHSLVKDVEAVEQRIALHSANLLAKRLTIQKIEHDNNTLQRKKRNLEELFEAVQRLRDVLQLDPQAEGCLERLRNTPDDALPRFFEDQANIRELSLAMRHMHEVIQNINLQRDFPIAAVKERKAYFLEQRRMIVFRSKAFLFSLIHQYEKRYLSDSSRRSKRRVLVWRHHSDLHRILLEMGEIMKATGRIDMEGFTSLLRCYRVSMRRVYAAELSAFFHQLQQQMRICKKKPFLIGSPMSRRRAVQFRAETLQFGDVLPPRGLLPLPGYAELVRQVPPAAAPSRTPTDADGNPPTLPLPAAAAGSAALLAAGTSAGGIASSATALKRGAGGPHGSSGSPAASAPPVVLPDVKEHERLLVELPCTPSCAATSPPSLHTALLRLYRDPEVFSAANLRIAAGNQKFRFGKLLCGSSSSSSAEDGELRPDLALAMALQCTMEALLMEETVLSQCFGIEEGTHYRAAATSWGDAVPPPTSPLSPAALMTVSNNSLLSIMGPEELRAYQAHQAHLLQECLIELFGGDTSAFSIVDQVQSIGARMLWVGESQRRRRSRRPSGGGSKHQLSKGRKRRSSVSTGPSGGGGGADAEAGLWSSSSERDDEEMEEDKRLPGGGRVRSGEGLGGLEEEEEMTITTTPLFFHTQRILRQNFLFLSLSRLATYVVRRCDLTYAIPILCMLQRYMTPGQGATAGAAGSAPGTMAQQGKGEEAAASPGTSSPDSLVGDPAAPRPPPPTVNSTFCMVLLREVETIMAGAMLRHLEEQVNSIRKGKKAYCIHPTALFCGFTNLPLYVFRMEALLNALSADVCDSAPYKSILTTVVGHLFAALDELTGVVNNGGNLLLYAPAQLQSSSPVSSTAPASCNNIQRREGSSTTSASQGKRRSTRKPKPLHASSSSRPSRRREASRMDGEGTRILQLKGRDALRQKINFALDGHLRLESLKSRYIQQYRHHVFFCTFFQTLSPLSHAAAALRSFFDISTERRYQYESLYLQQVLLAEDFPTFASFTSTAEELLQVYSPEELRHHRALSVEVVQSTVNAMAKEIPNGIRASSERMKQHLLGDVGSSADTLDFHRTLLQRTWQHFCRLLEKKMDFMENLLAWPVYASVPSMQSIRERALRDMQDV
eukprot:gene7872-5499_t